MFCHVFHHARAPRGYCLGLGNRVRQFKSNIYDHGVYFITKIDTKGYIVDLWLVLGVRNKESVNEQNVEQESSGRTKTSKVELNFKLTKKASLSRCHMRSHWE